MKLMFFPVTIIEDLPHLLLNYNFSRRRDRYFLSPYDVDVSTHGSQKTVCQVIRSSDFLCGLLNIDRPAILKELSMNKHVHVNSTGSTTAEETPSPLDDETLGRRALSCSVTVGGNTTSTDDLLLEMIEQKLDFKHRCVFYSTGPISDVCVCALEVDHNSSILCNAIGYSISSSTVESTVKTNETDKSHRSSTNRVRAQHRNQVHQWICIRDIVDGLITCNHILKSKTISEILNKMDLWVKQRNSSKPNTSELSKLSVEEIKIYKSKARQLIWDLMDMKNEVRFPRPAHGRIPNFRYCEVAAENVTELECFMRARVIKINPSLAQEALRYFTLSYNKILLVPTPALESVLCYKLDPKMLRRHQYEWAATKTGAAELGTPLSLNSLKQMHVDVVVVASVVVNPITGARIGKGKGYADLEYGIMSQLGAVDKRTIIITTCHESQLINDLPSNIMEEHDLAVDIIVTPKRYIYTKRCFQRPERVFWEKIDSEMMINIPILKELKRIDDQEQVQP